MRWQLVTPHYLHTAELIEWEHSETDPITQRQNRKRYVVPLYMPADTIVCQGHGERGDTEFIGEPTPDMMPLDEEARALSDSLKEKWQVSDYGVGSESILDNLGKHLAEAMSKGVPVASVSGVSQDAFNNLQDQVMELMKQNAQLLAKVLEEPKGRRV